MESRQKQVIINDLMSEFEKFGTNISNIRNAIQNKGVTSEGVFSKFADEINLIQSVNSDQNVEVYRALDRAYTKGYSREEILSIIDGLADKNHQEPPQPEPKKEYVDSGITEIPNGYATGTNFNGATELILPNVTKIASGGLDYAYFNKVVLRSVTEIEEDAFHDASIYDLEVPSFIWNSSNSYIFSRGVDLAFTNVVIHDDSHPPKDMESKVIGTIFNTTKDKKWNFATEKWVDVNSTGE